MRNLKMHGNISMLTTNELGNCKMSKEVFDSLYNTLVPNHGNCATLDGEYLRAINKINYDGYNNGFCNNTSGPYNFLVQEFGMLDVYPEFEKLKAFVNRGYSDKLTEEIKTILDCSITVVIEHIVRKNGEYTLNTYNIDMFHYTDLTNYDEECDE
jgi:hypothetical protein